MQQSHAYLTPKIIGFFVILAVTASGAYVFLWREITAEVPATTTTVSRTEPSSVNTAADQTSADEVQAPNNVAGVYLPGTYTGSVSYQVPAGHTNSLLFSLTLGSDGTVTDVSSESSFTDQESRFYIESFETELTGSVVGKPIDEVALSRLGGASLTTQAFTGALQDVANQARAS